MSTRAAQIELLLDSLIDPTTGGICSDYTVEFYMAGTSTPKNVWTEKEKTNPFTTYTLDGYGKALLYGDGIYDIDVKNTDGALVLSLESIKIQANTFSVVQKTGTYTATPDDDVILCNGTFTVNLDDVDTFNHPLTIKNIGSGTITIDPYAAQTIDGDATIQSAITNQVITIFPDVISSVWRAGYSVNDSASLSFLQAGTGADTRTVQEKLREVSVSVGDFTAPTDGTTDARAQIVEADDSTTGQIIFPIGSYKVASNLTITSPVVMDAGAMFVIPTGVTLTLNGGITAGPHQVFSVSGTGAVRFGTSAFFYALPEWWGASIGNSAADNSAPLQACLNDVMGSTFRPPVFFSVGIYSYDTGLTITYPQGMRLVGASGGYYTPQAAGYTSKVTTLYYTGAGNGLTLGDGGTSNGTGFNCSNIYFKGTSSATGGVILNVVSGLVFRDCTFGQFTKTGGYGFYQTNGQTNSFYNCSFIGNYYGTSLGQGAAENSTTRFYDCVWHSNTNHAFKIEHAIGQIVLYSPLFQDNAGSAIFADGTIGPKPLGGIKIYNAYVAGSNASVAGPAIDIRGSAESGAASWASGIVIDNPYFATPGASQAGSIRLRNTVYAIINEPIFGSIATTEIIAATADNYKLSVNNFRYASSYIKDAAGGNTVYWSKLDFEDTYQRIFRGGDVLIHQEAPAGAVAPLTLQQSDVSEPAIKIVGSEAASSAETISIWTVGAVIQGYVQVRINNTVRWMPFYSAPVS